MNLVFEHRSKVIGSHDPPTFSIKLDRIIENCGDFIIARYKVALKSLFINAVILGSDFGKLLQSGFL